MKIRWLGHSCFQIETTSGVIVTDPMSPRVGYPVSRVKADVVTISHQHYDHCDKSIIEGNPVVFEKTGSYQYQGIDLLGIPSFHDQKQGKERGNNIIFRFQADGVSFAHLGDLGEVPSDEARLGQLRGLDLVMIPVGSVYTIDADQAYQLVQSLSPRVVIPMHYKTPHLTFDLDPVEKFLIKFPHAEKVPELIYPGADRNQDQRVVVFDYLPS